MTKKDKKAGSWNHPPKRTRHENPLKLTDSVTGPSVKSDFQNLPETYRTASFAHGAKN